MSDSFEDIMAGVLDDTPDIIVDQDMQKAIDRAREINETLRSTECSVDQMRAYVAEVDALWQEWHKQALIMSGIVFFELSSEDISSTDLNGQIVYSDSFCVARSPIDDIPSIFHRIKIHPFDILPEDDPRRSLFSSLDPDDVPFIDAIAPLDVSVDPGYFTAERALQYMELFHPDLVAEIDCRIINTNSSEEALLALRNLPFATYIELDSEVARAALSTYLNSLVAIDDTMPHLLVLGEGRIYAEAEEEGVKQLTVLVNGESFYAIVHNTVHFANLDDGKNQDYALAVDISILSADHREDERKFCVPIDVIISQVSTRNQLLGG